MGFGSILYHPTVLVSCVGMCPTIAARMPGLGDSHLGSIRSYATIWEERSAVKISQVRSHLLLWVPVSGQARDLVSFDGKNTQLGKKSLYTQSQVQRIKSNW